jgi:hypothetical protein
MKVSMAVLATTTWGKLTGLDSGEDDCPDGWFMAEFQGS